MIPANLRSQLELPVQVKGLESGGCIVIGEVAQSHDGSLGMAHAFIDAIARAGADAVKFQTHIAAAESTPAEPWRVKFGYQDKSRYEYWKRMEFTEDQWAGLKKHADDLGLLFLSSPFSGEAVELLSRIGIAAWKVASGEAAEPAIFASLLDSGRPIFMSTGMSTLPEIDVLVDRLKSKECTFAVMQCTTAYPCPPERVGMNVVKLFRDRYNCPVGLSDHSGTIFPGLAGAALGIDVLEVHVALSREMFGPDVPASITTPELRELVTGMRFIENMNANPVNKDSAAEELEPLRKLFTKSVVAGQDIQSGTVLSAANLAVKKPGSGIPASEISRVIGARLKRDVKRDELIRESDLEAIV